MLFSIIIATYNADETVIRCLDSIASQSFADREVIVVDGGSQDNTISLVASHSCVTHYLSERDNGIYDAWNKGISLSGGDWIVFVGADDFLAPGSLGELAVVCREGSHLDLISGRVGLVDAGQTLRRVVGEAWDWSAFRHGMNIAHPGAAHNRRLFDEVGLYDPQQFKIVGDYELLLRKGGNLKAVFVDQVIAYMTVGGVSYMSAAALVERYRAKNRHNSVGAIRNSASLFYAYIRLQVKSLLMTLGLVRI